MGGGAHWTVTIQGMGCIHNHPKLPCDANRLAAEFVEKLKAEGQLITKATITYGVVDDITDGAAYEAECAKKD